MNKSDEIMAADAVFAGATADMRKALPGKPGFGAESRYGDAYQHLVRLGEKPQLRLKYRRK